MELPSPTTIQGAFNYLILFILLLAFVCGVYIAASYIGIAPGL
jgi:Na+-transporting NADH:ubiquinone oxidoreductase subunit NqrC